MPSLQGFLVENFVSHQIQPFCAFLQKKAEKRKPEGARARLVILDCRGVSRSNSSNEIHHVSLLFLFNT